MECDKVMILRDGKVVPKRRAGDPSEVSTIEDNRLESLRSELSAAQASSSDTSPFQGLSPSGSTFDVTMTPSPPTTPNYVRIVETASVAQEVSPPSVEDTIEEAIKHVGKLASLGTPDREAPSDAAVSGDLATDVRSLTELASDGPSITSGDEPASAIPDAARLSSLFNLKPKTVRSNIPSTSCATTDLVKFGNESVHTTDLTETPIYQLPPPPSHTPDFLRRGMLYASKLDHNYYKAADGFFIKSNIVPVISQGATGVPVAVGGQVFPARADPFKDINVHTYEVRWSGARQMGDFPVSDLAPFLNGNVPSARFVSSLLQPELRPANAQLLNSLSGAILNNLFVFDNEALYAKLITIALTWDIYTVNDAVPTAVPFPQAVPVTQVNLDDAALTAPTITDQMAKGSIFLLEDTDFDFADLQVIYYLAASGRRYVSAANTKEMHAAYIDWPAIPVCLLQHGAAKAAPAAAVLTSQAIMAFVYKIATTRNEWDALMRGIYVALDLVGVRYHTAGANAYHITSNLNAYHTFLPAPADYNFMLRVARLYPPADAAARVESESLYSYSSRDRVRGAAFYSACYSAFSTTLLFSLSFTTAEIADWAMGREPHGFANQLLSSGICLPRGGPTAECAMYLTPKVAFRLFTGFTVLTGLYPGSSWQGGAGQNANADSALAMFNQAQAPRLMSPLTIDNMILVRPQEWGILGHTTQIDITQDLRNVTTAAKMGVFTYRGEKEYSQRAASATPYLFVPYGVQMLNAISQYLKMVPANVHYKYSAAAWHTGAGPEWDAPVDDARATYKQALFIMEPCTMTSFDYATMEVRAPAFTSNTLLRSYLTALSSWRGQIVDYVGFVLERNQRDPNVPLEPPPIAAFAQLSMFGGSSQPPAGAEAASPTAPSAAGNPP